MDTNNRVVKMGGHIEEGNGGKRKISIILSTIYIFFKEPNENYRNQNIVTKTRLTGLAQKYNGDDKG